MSYILSPNMCLIDKRLIIFHFGLKLFRRAFKISFCQCVLQELRMRSFKIYSCRYVLQGRYRVKKLHLLVSVTSIRSDTKTLQMCKCRSEWQKESCNLRKKQVSFKTLKLRRCALISQSHTNWESNILTDLSGIQHFASVLQFVEDDAIACIF